MPAELISIEDMELEKRNRAQNDSKRGKFKVSNGIGKFLVLFFFLVVVSRLTFRINSFAGQILIYLLI